MIKSVLKIFLIVILFAKVLARPDGAPESQTLCETLEPQHGVNAQEGISPYRLVVSSTSVNAGESIEIEILTDDERSFKGFFLIAATKEESRIIGEFSEYEEEDTPFNFRSCSDGFHNAVTHFSSDPKRGIKFLWKAPKTFNGAIYFR